MNDCDTFYVADGFREDCKKLISQFEISNKLNFQSFCQIWNDMKFCYVFSGRATHSELLEFCEEALDIAKEFVSSVKSFKTKIGGIYLLYSLFFTMPVSQPKIRIILTEWDNIIKLQHALYLDKQYDAIYILQQLIEKNAFNYCCSEHERGLENYYLLKDFVRGKLRVTQLQRQGTEWGKIFDDVVAESQSYLREKNALSKFSEHLVPKVFDGTEVPALIDTIRKIDNADDISSGASSINYRTEQSSNNENSTSNDSPSTSKDVDTYALHMKFDSGDDSDTSEESDDEQYQ